MQVEDRDNEDEKQHPPLRWVVQIQHVGGLLLKAVELILEWKLFA